MTKRAAQATPRTTFDGVWCQLMASTITHMARRSHRDPDLSLVAASSPLWAILVTFLASLTGRIWTINLRSHAAQDNSSLASLQCKHPGPHGASMEASHIPHFFLQAGLSQLWCLPAWFVCAVPHPCLLRRAHCCYQLMAWEQVIHGSTNKRQGIPLWWTNLLTR